MYQYVPAQLGWYVLTIVGGVEFRRDPIIAWRIEAFEVGPVPITSARVPIPLDENHVIVTPDGKVVDAEERRGEGDNVEGYIQRVQQCEDKRDQELRDQKATRPVAALTSLGPPHAALFASKENGPFKNDLRG
jgi:hypothetical protein